MWVIKNNKDRFISLGGGNVHIRQGYLAQFWGRFSVFTLPFLLYVFNTKAHQKFFK